MRYSIKISDLTLEELQNLTSYLKGRSPIQNNESVLLSTNIVAQKPTERKEEVATQYEELEAKVGPNVKEPDVAPKVLNPELMTEKELSEAVKPIVKRIGLEKVRKVLADFEAKTILDLKQSSYHPFIEKMQQLDREQSQEVGEKAPWTI